MTRQGVGRAWIAVVVLAAAAAAAGCGGAAKKLVGSWTLDMGQPAGVSSGVTMTFRDDRTGRIDMEQTVSAEMPRHQSVNFEWELKGEKLLLSLPAQGTTQEFKYEFDENGDLLLKAGQQAKQRYKRVESQAGPGRRAAPGRTRGGR